MTVGFKVVNAAGVLMADEQGLVQVVQTLASVNLAISGSRSISIPPSTADVNPPYTRPMIAMTGTSASFSLTREATVHVWMQAGILNTSATSSTQAFRPGYVSSTGPVDVGRHDWRIAKDLVRNLLMWRFDRLSAGTYTVGLLGWTGYALSWETALLYNYDMAVVAMGI
jgi:hypothetical protein